MNFPDNHTLYKQQYEHDACGIGAAISIDGEKSYSIVDDALTIVERLEHRAGKDASGETGDGVGIMLQISHSFFSSALKGRNINIGDEGDYGVGMFFMPQNTLQRLGAKKSFEVICQKNGVEVLTWRNVPVDESVLGETAKSSMPYIMQCFVKRPAEINRGLDFDRKLYVIRRVFEQSNENTYVASFSSRTICYKGMFLVKQLRSFYKDLQDKNYKSAIAMVHSRFSTNTMPSWERAHPNRMILHNGEINTIRGNADRMIAREETMHSKVLENEMDKILPVITASGSDSAMLDNALEFFVMNGVPLPLAVMMMIPEPWQNDSSSSREKKDLYRYYATMMEPWDGPAAILFSDGELFGAVLDRNGLRPARYYVTKDNKLILSSEVGVLDIPPENILEKSRLTPGKMLLVDTKKRKIITDRECKDYYAKRKPYGEWLDKYLVTLSDLPIPNKKVESYTEDERNRLLKAFGYTEEDITNAILPMAKTGSEPTASMGADIPLAVLSEKHQPLFNYFKQLFAQVTNPPIDALREEIVTDTTVYVGSDGNLLDEKAENCRVLQINNPILTSVDLMKIKNMNREGFKVSTVSLLYYKNTSLEKALDRLFIECDRAHRNGANIIILSDRGVDENHVAIPSLLAVSAIEQYLVRTKKRTEISIILESAEPREVHHFATLLGYGARAINPYMAQDIIASLIDEGRLDKDYHTAIADYNNAILHGMVKIAAKMGISTLQSYQSAQIFEAVGIKKEVIDKYFTNTVSPVEGIGLEEISEGIHFRHNHAFDP
ncbi:MAG: glutamate synthase central domain-containing protein, partial [Monoglobales bacterium]